jgi:CubicO group peptidase (beta-lactamase class C family)
LPPLALLALVAVLSACESSGRNPGAASIPPAAFSTRLDTLMPELLDESGVEGAAIAVVEKGDLTLLEGYGLADTGRRVLMTPDHVFNVASVSKLLTAWGVMRLVEQGSLGLDVAVNDYLERWQLPDGAGPAKEVTIRRLLAHTAGISMPSVPAFRYPEPVATLVDTASGNYTHSVYASAGTKVEIVQAPGAGFEYSGGGYVLLQMAVEDVTGQAFGDYMAAAILAPAGMSASRYGWTEDLAAGMATPYLRSGREEDIFRFGALAGSALHASARDLARFMRIAIADAEGEDTTLLSKDSVTTMLSPGADTGFRERELGWMALGHFVEKDADGDVVVASHSGDNAGWSSRLMFDPARGNGLVVMTNSDDGGKLVRQLSCLWLDAFTTVAAGQDCPAKQDSNALR